MTDEEKLEFCQDFHWEYFVKELGRRVTELSKEECFRAFDVYREAFLKRFGRFILEDYYVRVGERVLRPVELWLYLERSYEERAKVEM